MAELKQDNVSIRQLDIHYGDFKAIDKLDLDIKQGEFLVLLGPSGCGKSTLLNSIAGLVDVTDGQIWIGGDNVTWAEPSERGIGMVFQSYALYPRMTVEQNLSFGLRMTRMPKSEIQSRVAKASKMLQLDDMLKRKPAALSGGQRQRVAIGRALVRDAEVFLFDEPLSNLDAKLRVELRVEIKRLHQELGNTMIYVTHDQVEAMTLADRIAVMKNGVIQQLGRPQDVYRYPVNRFVANFIGSPAMNFIDGELRDGQFLWGDYALPVSDYVTTGQALSNGSVTLGIRPEDMATDEEGGYDFVASGPVELVEPMGADTLVWTRLAGESVFVRVDGKREFERGQSIPLAFNVADISLFDADNGQRL